MHDRNPQTKHHPNCNAKVVHAALTLETLGLKRRDPTNVEISYLMG